MQDISDVWFIAGSKNGLRPSLHSALRAAHDFWSSGDTVIAISAMGCGLRLDPPAIMAAWRELDLPGPTA